LGKGSTFWFTVKLERCAEVEAGAESEAGAGGAAGAGAGAGAGEGGGVAAERSTFKGHCIMLAEDVEVNREIVYALLEPTQLEIVPAENGAEALNMFTKEPERYELIFMDVQMPRMNGLEATRQIRALDVPQAKTLPIVAMTASVFREDIEKCLAAGMDDHVGKPLDLSEVMRMLNLYLKQETAAE
ncbi:MAG: response regulator, partial [Coriobacteriales bacterium]|nr:response regulator [Coriobacteriales bacterium]